MSETESAELTKSWVMVSDDEKNDSGLATSGVQDVDSDTDSISVISESGCSHKTDEEDSPPPIDKKEEEAEDAPKEDGAEDAPKEDIEEPPEPVSEKLYLFATSAVCAVVMIGLAVGVQQYLQGSTRVNSTNEVSPISDNYKFKWKSLSQNRIVKGQDDEFATPITQDLDNKLTGDLSSNYKPSKNKFPRTKSEKDNYDVRKRKERAKSDKSNKHDDRDHDSYVKKKIKELKVKEKYLTKKEKILLEKEHRLRKQEIKLNKDLQKRSKEDRSKLEKKKNHKCKEIDPRKNKAAKRYPKVHDHEQNRKRNISGKWYTDLHRSRDNIRQKGHASDWVFDRARARSNRRNKAFWYFQWMVDRARHRVKF